MRGAEGGEGHKCDLALLRKLDLLIVVTLEDAVAVLDLGHVDKMKRALHSCLRDVRQSDHIEFALQAEVHEGAQLLLKGHCGSVSRADQPQVDEVHNAMSGDSPRLRLAVRPVAARERRAPYRHVASLPWSQA